MDAYTLTGGVVVTPNTVEETGCVDIRSTSIASLSRKGPHCVDLHGSVVYPALMNSHDHLRGNYLPAVGPKPGSFYLNWLPWDNDLKGSATYTERSKLSEEELYFNSAYKNLFSGVVTVNDHFPHEKNRDLLPRLPIRAIQEYTLAHEASSFDLKWGTGILEEHELARKNDWPFITHLEEGFDPESQAGVDILEKLKCLDEYCLLIHCIGFSDVDIEKVARARASVSWCPYSNMLMFNTTAKVKKLLAAGVNVALGTDSSASGSVNLLAEMRFARDLYRKMYGEELSPRILMDMVTMNTARAFRIEKKTGSIEEGKLADLLVLKNRHDDPHENLVEATMQDIELLVMEGKPIYGEERFLDLLDGKIPVGYTSVKVGGRRMFVKGDPAALYTEIRRKVGFKKVLDYLPFEPGA